MEGVEMICVRLIGSEQEGYKYKLEQRDEYGLLLQFMLSGGTFQTRGQASTAIIGIIREIQRGVKESEYKMTSREKLKQIIEKSKLSIPAIARKAEINQQTLYNYLSGRSEVKTGTYDKILEALRKFSKKVK